ncbi:hypothetical protein T08_5712 [Trichinella sp. T8]|nr:hypothetical protein T08_5712 [Trichinella sp. T8]
MEFLKYYCKKRNLLFSRHCDAGGIAGSFEKSITETVFVFLVIMLGVRGEKKMYTMLANPLFFDTVNYVIDGTYENTTR